MNENDDTRGRKLYKKKRRRIIRLVHFTSLHLHFLHIRSMLCVLLSSRTLMSYVLRLETDHVYLITVSVSTQFQIPNANSNSNDSDRNSNRAKLIAIMFFFFLLHLMLDTWCRLKMYRCTVHEMSSPISHYQPQSRIITFGIKKSKSKSNITS